ncbi:MAG: hypothetical protein DMD46_17190 [Gemmatimonadetes bacterium]|nr:MAG: hypothetical protein DMD46_17190 [Gemmatimonadota bacterium]
MRVPGRGALRSPCERGEVAVSERPGRDLDRVRLSGGDLPGPASEREADHAREHPRDRLPAPGRSHIADSRRVECRGARHRGHPVRQLGVRVRGAAVGAGGDGCRGAADPFRPLQGVRLHVARLVIPASAALTLTERLGRAFVLSVVFGVSSALVGFYLSFVFSLPTGPAMLTTAGLFLIPGGARTLFLRWRPGGGGA